MDTSDVRAQFNAAASTYGGWHRQYAERLIELTPLNLGQTVLDVGTGTGLAAIAAAKRVGPTGRVVGIDVAEQMVEQATRAAAMAGLANVTFRCADAAGLPFDGASFDVVVCSSAIIYLPLPGAVEEWRRVTRPLGVAALSTLRTTSPRTGVLFRETAARFGIHLGNPNGIGSPGACRALLATAGFETVDITAEAIPGDPTTSESAWRGNIGSAAFASVRRQSGIDLDRLKAAYFAALLPTDLAAPHDVLFAVGRRSN